MMKLLYFVLAGPFIIPAKIVEFLTWEVVGDGGKRRDRQTYHRMTQDQGAYIQRLLKENVEEKKRSDDLHALYKRQQKHQVDIHQRELRDLEDRYRRRNS